MNWYYSDNGQQRGPVSDLEFTQLVREGKVKGDALVWQEGLPDWQPLSKLRPDLLTPASSVTAAGPVVGGVPVMEQNKDVLVQQLREGAVGQSGFQQVRYAGFWIRVAAYIIDYVLFYIVNLAITFMIVGSFIATIDPAQFDQSDPAAVFRILIPQFIAGGIGMAIYVAYRSVMVWKWGATLGKMAVGIKVVTVDNQPVSAGRAVGRAFADILNWFTCTLAYLMPAFDEPEKRALHDHICATRVIYK